jgi:MerR family copper efflux transcriptional regulator
MAMPLPIGELAKQAGVKSDAIRFYERSGLLPKPQRLSSGYRSYDEVAVNRLRFIKKAQALGFSLDEIRRILNLSKDGKPACQCVIAMAEATLSETEARVNEMQQFATALRKNLFRWKRMSAQGGKMASEFCALIESAE